MSHQFIGLFGSVSGAESAISGPIAARLAAVALRGNIVLATAPVDADGTFHIKLPHSAAHAQSAYSLDVAVLPLAVASEPGRVADAPRRRILRPALKSACGRIDLPPIDLPARLIGGWSVFWQDWTVSGTLLGADGHPAPAAEVTVSTVTWSPDGFPTRHRAIAVTDVAGHFTLCFDWFEQKLCWPSGAVWWDSWPRWWEQDILHVISALEDRNLRGPAAAALIRPDPASLIRGHGFPRAGGSAAVPDAGRTALIARKFANPALRDIFPWRWWCHTQPNVIFSASQAGLTILAEDPAVDTRWAMASGQSVNLMGNAQTLTTGDARHSSGNAAVAAVADTGMGSNPAHAFNLYAALGPAAACYRVRVLGLGGVPGPVGGTSAGQNSGIVTEPFSLPVWIFEPGPNTLTQADIVMGPFSVDGAPGYYATPKHRAAGPIVGLPPFPDVSSTATLFWGEQGLVLQPDAQALLAGCTQGGVQLTLQAFNAGFQCLTRDEDTTLKLKIDASSSQAAIIAVEQCKAFGLTAQHAGRAGEHEGCGQPERRTVPFQRPMAPALPQNGLRL